MVDVLRMKTINFLKSQIPEHVVFFINLAIFDLFDCCFKHSPVGYNLRKITVVCFLDIDRKNKRLINGGADTLS